MKLGTETDVKYLKNNKGNEDEFNRVDMEIKSCMDSLRGAKDVKYLYTNYLGLINKRKNFVMNSVKGRILG